MDTLGREMTDAGKRPNDSTLVVSGKSPGFGMGAMALPSSLKAVDLSGDMLLRLTSRVTVENTSFPALGGIPLLSKLGQGGMGAVYLGFHPRLRKEVAIKVLPLTLAAMQPAMIQRFVREAQLAAQVQSPHLVGVLDVNEENGLFYIVMEYVLGQSAQDCLKKLKTGERLSEATVLDICQAACQGLADAHAAGIVHRDIKPDNILIPRARDGAELLYKSAKLSDLGLARNEQIGQGLTGSQAGMGTAGFMAPEQATNAQSAGKPADVYGMAATMFALLAGRPPFYGTEPMQIILQTLQETAPPVTQFRPDASAGTAQLLQRCLSKDPAHRLADAGMLLADLNICRAALTGTPPPLGATLSRIAPIAPAAPAAAGTPKPAASTETPSSGLVGKFFSYARTRYKYSSALSKGRKALAERRWSEAEAAFREALQDVSGDPAAAKGIADACAGASETRFSTAFSEGKTALDNARWEEAKAAFARALGEKPEDPDTHTALQRAEEGHRLAQHNAAIQEVLSLLEGEKEDAEAHFSLLSDGKRRQAEDALIRAETFRSGDPVARNLAFKIGEPKFLVMDLGGGVHLDLVRVRSGEFEMGSDDAGTTGKRHGVRLSRSYYIGRCPVAVSQFSRFTQDSGYLTDAERHAKGWTIIGKEWAQTAGANWKNPGFPQRDNYPAVLISWRDALAFSAWVAERAAPSWSPRSGKLAVTLPTEAQWEFAARGPSNLQYPWGNSWEGRRANHADVSLQYRGVSLSTSTDNDGYPFTSPLGNYPNESWCGAIDMVGNVWEWCSDWYSDDFYSSDESLDPAGPVAGTTRVLRGGSWADMPLKCRAYRRHSGAPGASFANIGFRVMVCWTPQTRV